MKLLVQSISTATGLSKATNTPFSIPQLVCLIPFETVETSKYQNRGVGLTTVQMQVANDFFPELERELTAKFQGMPIVFDFTTSVNSRGQTIITGFEQQPAIVNDLSKPETVKKVFG